MARGRRSRPILVLPTTAQGFPACRGVHQFELIQERFKVRRGRTVLTQFPSASLYSSRKRPKLSMAGEWSATRNAGDREGSRLAGFGMLESHAESSQFGIDPPDQFDFLVIDAVWSIHTPHLRFQRGQQAIRDAPPERPGLFI